MLVRGANREDPEQPCLFKLFWQATAVCSFRTITVVSFLFQLNDQQADGFEALKDHPVIKTVTPHRKVTRTLKYSEGKFIQIRHMMQIP